MAIVGPEGSIKNTNIPIGNLTYDFPACGAVLRYRYMAYRVCYAVALWPVARSFDVPDIVRTGLKGWKQWKTT